MPIEVILLDSEGSDSGSGRSVTEYWRVIDTDGEACNIGPVHTTLIAGIPKVGQPYDPPDGCDSIDADLRCSRVSFGRVQRSNQGHCFREVTVTYAIDSSTPNGGPGQPNFGQPDPVLWVPEIELATASQKREVDFLPFVGAFEGDQYYENGDFGSPNPPFNPCSVGTLTPELYQDIDNDYTTRLGGQLGPLASSANEPFNPRESLEFSDLIVRYSFYSSNYDPSGVYNCYRGIGVNDAAITLSVATWSFTMTMPKHTAKLINILGRPGYRKWKDAAGNDIERYYWKTTIEIQHRRRGWYTDKLNVGTHRVARKFNANVADGFGGEWNYNDDFFPGMAPMTPIKGPDGEPVTSPVFLDLDGQPMLHPNNPWILRYVDGYLMDFTAPGLNLPLAP